MPVPTGVVSVASVRAVAAFFKVAAEHGSAARLNGAHDAELPEQQGMRRTVSRAMLSKNVSHFESGPPHGRLLSGLGPLTGNRIEWARRGGDQMCCHSDITRCGLNAAMTE